jgi:hypothetical protein
MNIANMLQQAQAAQAQLQKALGELEAEGSAGGGLVRVRLSGLKELKGVQIDAAALQGEEAGLVADLVMAAWEEATRQLDEQSKALLARMGMPPGLSGLL